MKFSEFKIDDTSKLALLLKQGLFWRKHIGLIVLSDKLDTHPKKVFWQNELNTHYYACGCDESAKGFFIGVVLGALWVASSWFQGVTPDLLTIIVGVLFSIAGGLIGKAIGKLIANNKLKQTIQTIHSEWPEKN